MEAKQVQQVTNPNDVAGTQSFSIEVAKNLKSMELATLIHFFQGAIITHKRLERNEKEGRTWNYCTYKKLSGIFPFWTIEEIKYNIEKLIHKGILIKGNFNHNPIDKTNWYAFKDEAFWKVELKNGLRKGEFPVDRENSPTNTTSITTPSDKQSHHPYPSKPSKQPAATKCGVISEKDSEGMSEEQRKTYQWLCENALKTAKVTRKRWSTTYGLSRIKECYREALKRNSKDPWAYVHSLLKKGSVVQNDRIEVNRKGIESLAATGKRGIFVIKERFVEWTLNGNKRDIDLNWLPEDLEKFIKEKYESTIRNR